MLVLCFSFLRLNASRASSVWRDQDLASDEVSWTGGGLDRNESRAGCVLAFVRGVRSKSEVLPGTWYSGGGLAVTSKRIGSAYWKLTSEVESGTRCAFCIAKACHDVLDILQIASRLSYG